MTGMNIRPEVFPAFMELARQAGEEGVPCSQEPELWYSFRREDQDAAKFMCGKCPLMWACRSFALDNRETEGVWGGTTAEEREELLRRMRTAKRIAQKHAAATRRRQAEAEEIGQQELFPVMA